MNIGAVLADARWRAHLTVDEVSHRTRIREAIIWGIEQGDFSACGGDAYARGHIRAIAQAVGIDPDPLIREYDEHYRTAEDIEDVVVLRPRGPSSSPGRAPRPSRRLRLAITTTLAVVVLAIVGWAAYHVASGTGPAPRGQAAAASGHASASRAAGAPAGRGSPQPSATPTAPSPAPSPTPTPAHSSASAVPAARALALAGAVPFGPGGEGTGDNPQTAALAIDSHTSTGWHSHWYTTPAFGNLKPGTGLLLDLGRRVTVTDAQLDLGGFYGADVQLRAGNEPAPSGLHEVASASGAGGTVRMTLKTPARAKYVLIWFTRLPPDAAGTYQAGVYHVIVRGRP